VPIPAQLGEDSELLQDLGLDSLETFELLDAVQELASIESGKRSRASDEPEFASIMTLQELYEYFVRLVDAKDQL